MDTIDDKIRYAEKKTIGHLYKIIGRLTPDKLARYEYLMSFSVSIESKKLLQTAVNTATDYEQFKLFFGK